jgi:uncharacterized membrane protein YtjA (UPF0391 family)
MLKLAGVFLVVMIIAGILGFVVDVAGGGWPGSPSSSA